MKKGIKILTALLLTCAIIVPGTATAEEPIKQQNNVVPPVELAENAVSAVLLDADTGTIIYEKNGHEKLPPASITKIMTMLLVVEAIDAGKLKWTDKVRTSEYAASMGGSQIFLEVGEEMTVDDMLKGIAMASGNDASVAMAEKLAGTEAAFVEMMNKRAKELGMNDTHFSNCNGLPVDNHYSSAHDIAIMSRELLKHKDVTKYTGAYQDHLRKDSDKPFWLVNTNKLVRFYPGADGLKTGYTSEAKFCLSATAVKDGMRVVAVVLGEPNTKTRNSEVSNMLDYAFSQYMMKTIYKKGDVIGKVQIEKGNIKEIEIIADTPYSVLMKRGASDETTQQLTIPAEIKAPIAKGQVLGKLIVSQDNKVLKEFEIKAAVDVEKAGFWKLFKRTTSDLFR
ncbi:D-alanyl-D-alanine carboxypeptidase family protein [Paenibacillus polygoni]|uniref:serine-type D-Ala-D-Ala carboxypeptidase n=1 Tax=Paenibacillus polygoni TaxID=3050112 RepID=A0ABY8WZ51_9BACL|nr:D-alanyl-D-alanine carboxypeptidase family protein [Paenibacillus polygoni]WIV18013.1 D-alanyl-D-alanine carboxypeptidase family protein [Paenibacillus polygoni]